MTNTPNTKRLHANSLPRVEMLPNENPLDAQRRYWRASGRRCHVMLTLPKVA